MSNYKFKTTNIRGKQYVEVNERIKFFRQEEQYKHWSLITEFPVLDSEQCVCKASIADTEHRIIATGHAHEVQGSSNINKRAPRRQSQQQQQEYRQARPHHRHATPRRCRVSISSTWAMRRVTGFADASSAAHAPTRCNATPRQWRCMALRRRATHRKRARRSRATPALRETSAKAQRRGSGS